MNNNVIDPQNKAPNPSPATSNQQEPDFMQYIRNMNVNQISNNYVQGKSFKEGDEKNGADKIPDEYKGLTCQ